MAELEKDLSPRRVAELHERGDVQLVDVREDYEHEAGRIAGARHATFSELTEAAQTLDRDRPVVFYCRSGARSAAAADAFMASGFDAHNMTGGLLAWDAEGLALEPDDGTVAEH